MSNEEMPETNAYTEFQLKKRVSPSDYHDGLLQGLKIARDAIDNSIHSYEMTRQIFEASQSNANFDPEPKN